MAITREGLVAAVATALADQPERTAPLVDVARHIWSRHEADLRAAGDLFFTWQYDMRWAAQKLRDAKKLAYERKNGRPVWRLIGEAH
jgi:hypothetical protein